MFSPAEIPAFIESLVKSWRAIKDYSELDQTHRLLMQRCVVSSKKFRHLMAFVREPSYYSKTTWKYITELVAAAQVAVQRALAIALQWKKRLGISEKRMGSRAWRLIPWLPKLIGRRMLLDWKEANQEMEGLAHNGKDDIDDEDEEEGEAGAPAGLEKGLEEARDSKRPSYLKERFSEVVYLAVGKSELASALADLERLIENLNFAILTSACAPINPRAARGGSDILNFVSRAKRRRENHVAVPLIDTRDINVKNLEDIDTQAMTGIYRVKSGPYANCIVDPRDILAYVEQFQTDIGIKETENIARLFAEDPNAPESQLPSAGGILSSCGYTRLESCLFGIVFRYPPGCGPPCTLRRLLIEGTVKHSLNDRIDFAIKLSTSVLVVHSLGLVHKNIRPDAILVTESMFGDPMKLYPYKLGKPYLLSFDSSRSTEGTTMAGVFPYPSGLSWQTLYIHPRHFAWRDRKYEMRDDVFSLGVCLLEVALWKSFFRWDAAKKKYEDDTSVIDLSRDRLLREALDQGKPPDVDKSRLRQHIMIEAAEALVPPIMGDLFKDIIVACLTFGDPFKPTKNDVFQTRFEDFSQFPPEEQSIYFVRQILTNLRSIHLT